MINPVRMNSINTINNQKANSMAFKGREDADDSVFINDDESDNFGTDKQALKDLEEAKKSFKEMSEDNDNPKILKGALKLGIVAISGLIAGSAFKATIPEVKKVAGKIETQKIVKDTGANIKKALTTVFKPVKNLAKKSTEKLAEYKGSLDKESKKFKFLDKAETTVKQITDSATKVFEKAKAKVVNALSTIVGVSTSAEAYQEMKKEKEEV